MSTPDILERNLPPLFESGLQADCWPQRRAELLELFSSQLYGRTPKAPESVTARMVHLPSKEAYALAGKATHQRVELEWDAPLGKACFPVDLVIPKKADPVPLLVYLSFTPYPVGPYCPLEELVDNGYGLAIFCYHDVTRDEDDGFTSGIAPLYPREEGNTSTWGKIGMWAFAASRVLDYCLTRPEFDQSRAYVCGHSRLGKTALWCAAQDERFCGAYSNDSGCAGAAMERGKQGERTADITSRFPHWFAAQYASYQGRAQEMPMDQHMLMALIAPRLLYVASASQDDWADPVSEYLSCVAASPAYTLLGQDGLIGQRPMDGEDFSLPDGRIGYHLRPGMHFLSRQDWTRFICFEQAHAPAVH